MSKESFDPGRLPARVGEHVPPEPDVHTDGLARSVIGAAIEVHRELGPGFMEAVYEEALAHELELRSIPFVSQDPVEIHYKGCIVGKGKVDILVDRSLILELKTVDQLAPVHTAQIMPYLKARNLQLGLLINFNVSVLRDGIKRVVWNSPV